MNRLIKRSYKAIVNRGLIVPGKTTKAEFIRKMLEELEEAIDASYFSDDRYAEEITDFITVGLMQLHEMGRNFKREFKKVIIKNEKRKPKS